MKIKLLRALLLLLLISICIYPDIQAGNLEETNHPFSVHGKLTICNGNPPLRICVIGTNRVLGVKGGDLVPAEIPEKLKAIISPRTDVYADFSVTPLSKYQKGVKQIIRIDDAKNLVIYRNGKFVEKKEKL